MPSSITRYILTELVGWFSVFVVGLTLLMVVILVGSEAWRMNLGLLPTLRLIPFVLPTALVFAVPGTILFTVCLVYGRMSADNEVTAVKSAGISPMALGPSRTSDQKASRSSAPGRRQAMPTIARGW